MASSSRRGSHKNKHIPDSSKQGKAASRQGRKQNQPLHGRSFIEQIDRFVEPRLSIVLIASLFFTLFFGAFLFDVKISTGGDDSSYIEMANNFLKGVSFPSWHGPFYSVFLSLPILIFGVHVVMLKLLSFVFVTGHLVFFFYAFRKHFSPGIFAMVMLIVSVNSSILYFASQTYSEAMYMFLQSLIILLFIRFFLLLTGEESISFTGHIKYCLVIGFLAFIICLTRDIGIIMLISIVLFLFIQRKYASGIYMILSFFVFLIPYEIYKTLVWGAVRDNRTGNLSEIILKNHYNPAEGVEDFSGMIVRFFENARLYLSKHFMIGIGMHDPASTDKSWFVTFLVTGLLLLALFYAARRSRIMLFVAIYVGGALAATFIALQTSWDQMRMVVIYIPMMLILISYGILQLSGQKGYGILQLILAGLLLFVFFRTIGQTIDKMKDNRPILAENIRGDRYYGFTPDWQHFLMMSEWAGENLPDSIGVASRKPSMSFIYSKGRDFFGIYRLPVTVPGELIDALKNKFPAGIFTVPNTDLEQIPREFLAFFRSNALAFVAEGDDLHGIYPESEPLRDFINLYTGGHRISKIDADSLVQRLMVTGAPTYAVSPDSLLQELKDNRVEYVIMASLRADPRANTGRTINTVQRYLYFIEQKFPGIFSLVHQIGTDHEEPAWLYKINYDLYNI
ncbi:MAG: hypothetical protein JXA61_09375 [Bacteroidales bacterium]|nr:hypothetical protein [Bacteroidales bacterium]